MDKLRKNGFTLIEIMIVVAIIGVLLTIMIPNILRVRHNAQTNTCLANLKQIDSAIMIYLFEEGKYPSSINVLVPSYIRSEPSCPAGGTYTISVEKAACSVNGHELP